MIARQGRPSSLWEFWDRTRKHWNVLVSGAVSSVLGWILLATSVQRLPAILLITAGVSLFFLAAFFAFHDVRVERDRHLQDLQAARERPDLLVSASAPGKIFKPVAKGEHWTFWVTYPVAFMNAGARPITIVSADFSFSLEPLGQSEPPLWNESDPIHLRLPAELFPLKLDPGEARMIPLNLKLESSPSVPFQKGYTGAFKFELETTSGTINRDVKFILDAVTLNSRSDVLRH